MGDAEFSVCIDKLFKFIILLLVLSSLGVVVISKFVVNDTLEPVSSNCDCLLFVISPDVKSTTFQPEMESFDILDVTEAKVLFNCLLLSPIP